MTETYEQPGYGRVTFERMPEVELMRLTEATARRELRLSSDWTAHIQTQWLNVEIVVPSGTVFDGGSIPCFPLVSFLTGSVLRPLGVILVPALVHDYLYECGGRLPLPFYSEAANRLTRKRADELLRIMFITMNPRQSWCGHLVYHAVRLGRFFGNKWGYGEF